VISAMKRGSRLKIRVRGEMKSEEPPGPKLKGRLGKRRGKQSRKIKKKKQEIAGKTNKIEAAFRDQGVKG